jgi:hypothetical protein
VITHVHLIMLLTLKNVARGIRESSSTTKQLTRTLVRTDAFEEIARTILETTIAIRDTANEVNEISNGSHSCYLQIDCSTIDIASHFFAVVCH